MADKRDLQIESNIWRDRMQYAFKLHSCRLGFSFANDTCGCHRSMDRWRLGVSIFPFLNYRGYIFSVIFCSGIIFTLLLRSPLTLFQDKLITPGFVVDPAPELALVHLSLTQVPWFEYRPVNLLINIIQDTSTT